MGFIGVLLLASSFLIPLSTAQAPSTSGNAVLLGSSGTYPRATRLSDGSLLGIYTQFEGGNNTLTTVKSTDNGASWSPVGVVDTGPSAQKDIDNGFVHQLPSGKVLAAFRNHDRITSGGYSFYRITICVSEDGGQGWKYLSTPASDPGGVTGNWEPFLQTALDGSLQLYYSRENAGDDQDSLLRRSTDGGATWTSAQVISGQDVTARDGMLGVARTGANSQEKLAIFESGVNGLFTIHSVRSPDDGATWGSRALVYSPTQNSAGAPQIIRVGSRLVASFGSNEDGGSWPDQGAIKLLVSSDGGKTWSNKIVVHESSAVWVSQFTNVVQSGTDNSQAGLLGLDDNSFLVLYGTGGNSYSQKYTF